MVPETGLEPALPCGKGILSTKRKGGDFTRVTRSALQSEGYGHPDGHLLRFPFVACDPLELIFVRPPPERRSKSVWPGARGGEDRLSSTVAEVVDAQKRGIESTSNRRPDDRCRVLGTAGGNGPSRDCVGWPDRMICVSRLPQGV